MALEIMTWSLLGVLYEEKYVWLTSFSVVCWARPTGRELPKMFWALGLPEEMPYIFGEFRPLRINHICQSFRPHGTNASHIQETGSSWWADVRLYLNNLDGPSWGQRSLHATHASPASLEPASGSHRALQALQVNWCIRACAQWSIHAAGQAVMLPTLTTHNCTGPPLTLNATYNLWVGDKPLPPKLWCWQHCQIRFLNKVNKWKTEQHCVRIKFWPPPPTRDLLGLGEPGLTRTSSHCHFQDNENRQTWGCWRKNCAITAAMQSLGHKWPPPSNLITWELEAHLWSRFCGACPECGPISSNHMEQAR